MSLLSQITQAWQQWRDRNRGTQTTSAELPKPQAGAGDELTRLSADQIRSEIKRTSDLLGGCNFLRPPYGSYNNTVTTVAGELGLRLALWDVDTRDWESKNRDAIINRFKAEIKPGAIILMHDGGGDRSATVAALPAIIDWLLANGYAVTTLSRLT